MKIVTDIKKMQELGLQTRGAGLRVGLVPTMGALHEGHLELVRRARALGDVVVVSIFVNPMQFNNPDDFENYPRTIEADARLLESEGVDILFAPESKHVYPQPALAYVDVDGLGERLCGPGRPGHFRGVATVVSALFHMVGPSFAVFGEKDFQQLQVIRRMTKDQHFPVEIVAAPTVREDDGVAMSSRNRRLGAADRGVAAAIYRGLCAAADAFIGGEVRPDVLVACARAEMCKQPQIEIEYLELLDTETLEPVATVHADCVLAVAAQLGSVRLIDNILFSRVVAGEGARRRLQASATGVNDNA